MSSKLNCIEQRKKVQDHRRDGTFELANQTEDLEVDGMPTNTSRLSSNCHQLPLDLVIKLSKCDFGYVLPKKLFNFLFEDKGGLVNEDAIITMSNASIGELQVVILVGLLPAESKMLHSEKACVLVLDPKTGTYVRRSYSATLAPCPDCKSNKNICIPTHFIHQCLLCHLFGHSKYICKQVVKDGVAVITSPK